MKEEIDALERNSTWKIVNKPRDKKAMGAIKIPISPRSHEKSTLDSSHE